MEKEVFEVKANLDDLLFIFGAALRYGLGRQTYAPSLISGVIKDNLSLLNEKWTINLLRELEEYERNWVVFGNTDFNYSDWQELKQVLLESYKERGYTHSIE